MQHINNRLPLFIYLSLTPKNVGVITSFYYVQGWGRAMVEALVLLCILLAFLCLHCTLFWRSHNLSWAFCIFGGSLFCGWVTLNSLLGWELIPAMVAGVGASVLGWYMLTTMFEGIGNYKEEDHVVLCINLVIGLRDQVKIK